MHADATIGSVMIANGGRTTGFDYMRTGLSISVMLAHVVGSTYGFPHPWSVGWDFWRPVYFSIIPLFFALSGFLVAGSLFRTSLLSDFVSARVMRLVPALAVEVTLSAIILGPLVTSFTLYEYFTDPLFYMYFTNIIGEINFRLPGVFLSNPAPDMVNAQLWTLPYELMCYVALIGLALLGLRKRPKAILPVFSVALLGTVLYEFWRLKDDIWHLGQGHTGYLVLYFLCGVAFFVFREKIPHTKSLFWLSVVATYVFMLWQPVTLFSTVFMTYALCYIGVMNPKKTAIIKGDYSYGVFLYGFPIQQTYAYYAGEAASWYGNILICIPGAFAIAFLSWHIIEKPALEYRKQVGALFRLKFWKRQVSEHAHSA